MSIYLRVQISNRRAYLITVGNSVYSSSIYWFQVIKEDIEQEKDKLGSVCYASIVYSFYKYKKFRK